MSAPCSCVELRSFWKGRVENLRKHFVMKMRVVMTEASWGSSLLLFLMSIVADRQRRSSLLWAWVVSHPSWRQEKCTCS